jgi:hypothetical protein
MQRICRSLLGALLRASARLAAADAVKPPIRGLVSMCASMQ